jgi:hypothetical protein
MAYLSPLVRPLAERGRSWRGEDRGPSLGGCCAMAMGKAERTISGVNEELTPAIGHVRNRRGGI